MKYFFLVFCLMLCSLAGHAHAAGCEVKVAYEGKGAGQVIFNGALHLSKGFTCAVCHEEQGFSFALFEKKKGANFLSMKKMELGGSCGYCHNGIKSFSVADMAACSRCHHK